MDLKELKYRIHKEHRVEELLEYIGCTSIKPEQRGTLFTASLPDGDNKRSVQIKNSEALTVNIRSRGIEGTDVFGLVAYIIFECFNKADMLKCIPKSKSWICSKLGYTLNQTRYKEDDYEIWLKNALKDSKKNVRCTSFNPILSETILNEYINYPHLDFINDGIMYRTQQMFEIGYDMRSDRITIPIRDRNGKLIGIKGRYAGDMEGVPKYLYIYKCNKSLELFNYHRAFTHIKERNEVIVFESEKSCMKSTQMNFLNCVALGGDSISSEQRYLLQDLNVEIVLAYDKDKRMDFVSKQVSVIEGNVSIVYDIYGLLDEKSAPIDQGYEIWNKLYENKY